MAGAVHFRSTSAVNGHEGESDIVTGPEFDEDDFIRLDYGTAPFRSDRHFQVWAFHVSKCRLLLRSPASAEHPTSIDVHFGGVDALALPESFDGLHVRKADPDEATVISERFGGEIPHDWVYLLGPGTSSFVAGNMQWYEDDGKHPDPFGLT